MIKENQDNAVTPAPIFQSIFGSHWDQLPLVLQQHYAIRPFSKDRVRVSGVLDTYCAGVFRWFSFILKRIGTIPPFTEKQVATQVWFSGKAQSSDFHFQREFNFKQYGTYRFNSRLVPIQQNDASQSKHNEVVEHLGWGLGWHCAFNWATDHIKIQHLGYKLCVFGLMIPLPITWLLGTANATETALNESDFSMQVNITHPWWGKLYGYEGTFTIEEVHTSQRA